MPDEEKIFIDRLAGCFALLIVGAISAWLIWFIIIPGLLYLLTGGL